MHGLEKITTEEISLAAGISTRTFFNYYKNKEAAAIGVPPGFREEDKEALRAGTGALAADLKSFLEKHMEALASDEGTLRMVRNVLRSNEKARGILEGFLDSERDELTTCLFSRVNDREIASSLAITAANVTERAISLWEHDEAPSLAAALDLIWESVNAASRLLVISSG